ncbi:titin homolog isoform X2 [Patella vulgata]|uniref:titin homolog isoform X2 n=1 Tax=Patella vulgata TaxID=6465 RepID=UPI00217F26F7|nr:titin homolog isoform X2 [Patella vulgata]
MAEYTGKDEAVLQKLLENCAEYQERRKIRAALRDCRPQKYSDPPAVLRGNGVKVRTYNDRKDNGSQYRVDNSTRGNDKLLKDASKHRVVNKPPVYDSTSRLTSRLNNTGNIKSHFLLTSPKAHPESLKSDTTTLRSIQLHTTPRRHGSKESQAQTYKQNEAGRNLLMNKKVDQYSLPSESNYWLTSNKSYNTGPKLSDISKLPDKYEVKKNNNLSDSLSNRNALYTKRQPVRNKDIFTNDCSNNAQANITPLQQSENTRALPNYQTIEDQRKIYLDKASPISTNEISQSPSFIRSEPLRRSLPISGNVPSDVAVPKKELKSNIRTSLPLVQLGSSGSFNLESRNRPARRVSFEQGSKDFEISKASALDSDVQDNKDKKSFDDIDSEEELKTLLNQTTDLSERKKIRLRIKDIREREILASREKSSLASREIKGDNKHVDYDKIEDTEKLRTLLNETSDYEEKRKIRSAIRQLRKQTELEKVSTIASAPQRSSSLTVPKKLSNSDSSNLSEYSLNRGLSPQLGRVGSVCVTQFSARGDNSTLRADRKLTNDSKVKRETDSLLCVKDNRPKQDISKTNTLTYRSGRKSIDEDIIKHVKKDLTAWDRHEAKKTNHTAKAASSNKPLTNADRIEKDTQEKKSVLSHAQQHKETFILLKKKVRESLSQSTESLLKLHKSSATKEQCDQNLRTESPISEDVFKRDLLEKSRRHSVTSSPNKKFDDRENTCAVDDSVVTPVRKRSRVEMERAFTDILNDLEVKAVKSADLKESENDEQSFNNISVSSENIQLLNTENTELSNKMDEVNGNRVITTLKPIIFNECTTPMQSMDGKVTSAITNNSLKTEENNNTELNGPGLETIEEDKDILIQKRSPGLQLPTDSVEDEADGCEETGQISPLVSDLQPKSFIQKRSLIRSKSLNLRPTSPTNCKIDVQREEDGTIKVQQTTQSNNKNRIVTITTRKYQTPDETNAEVRDTVVETKFSSPGGSQFTERDEIHTKKRITSRGSNYFERSALVTKRVKDREGGEIIQQDVTDEKSNQSVTSGLSWGDRTTSHKLVSKRAPDTVPMIGDTKKSHAILVLNKLNVSKASSGYGSVSGSEEEDKEDILDGKIERPSGCPSIVMPLKDLEVTEGSNVTLECVLIGSPTPEITWYQEKEPIPSSTNFMILFDVESGKASLNITDTPLSCNGVISCFVKNDLGEAETKCQFTVKKKPKHAPVFMEFLHDTKVPEGHSTTLVCRVLEAETVSWYKDGVIQKNSPDFKQTFDGEFAKLEIGEVFLDDVGTYICVAKNDLGEKKTSCKLRVTACSSETSVVPMFLTRLTNKSVQDGSRLVLECDVIGTPEPKVMWMRNDSSLPDYTDYCESYDGRLARLEIPVITIKDAGRYEIVAENSAGRVSMDSIITIQASQSPPTITQPLSNKTGRAGDRVKLQCGIFGTPKPTITWRKNGMVIGQTKDFVQSYNSNNVAALEISGVCEQDSGSYECVATSPGGETSCTCQLIVEASTNSLFSSSPSPYSQTIIQEPPPTTIYPSDKPSKPSVSQLRMQFQVGSNQSEAPKSSIRRWHSLPPQENKFSIHKGEISSQSRYTVRDPPVSNYNTFTMSSYDHITNEEELQKLMNETESFDEKKKIRTRIRTLHEEQRADYDKKRRELEQENEKAMRRKYEIADEEKQRKMDVYKNAPPTGVTSTSGTNVLADKQKLADAEKQKKLEGYSQVAEKKTGADGSITTTTTTITTEDKKTQGGTSTTVKKTTLTKTSTPMGMSYGKQPADQAAKELTNKILSNCGYGTSGQISVKTESWNSKDGLVEKSQKKESWGGGTKGAMAAFKQMDKSSPGQLGKPKITRSPSAIKQMLLEWTKAMTREYENVEVTNFSSSWNNGMAFCALIHHFYPDSFDFSKLDPKKRRDNFNLAFDKAEELADIAPLLDVEDMVKMKNPDWKCVFTYVQSFYRKLRDHERNKAAPASLPKTVEQ